MLLVLCNTPPDHSKAIARKLVSERLAACVNLIPGLVSFYWWKERFCEEGEDTLLIKVSKEGHAKMYARLLEIHPYSVPEIVTIEPDKDNAAYRQWVHEALLPPAPVEET